MKKVSLLLLIIILHHSGAYSQNAPVLRDTIEHYVVERTVVGENVHAKIFKEGTFSDSAAHSAHYKSDYDSNRSALWQATGGFPGQTSARFHEIVRKTLCIHPEQYSDTDTPGWLLFQVTLSLSLNVEHLGIVHRGGTIGDLSAQDCYSLYKAINESLLYQVWDEPVPYVSFSIRVPLVPDSQ